MKPYQIIRVFQILAVIMTFLFPFTGVIALFKTIQANSSLDVDQLAVDKYLSESYKWLMITLYAFLGIYSFLLFALGYLYLSN